MIFMLYVLFFDIKLNKNIEIYNCKGCRPALSEVASGDTTVVFPKRGRRGWRRNLVLYCQTHHHRIETLAAPPAPVLIPSPINGIQ